MRRQIALLIVLAALPVAAQQLPHPDHIVVVIEENKDFDDVIDPQNTPPNQSRAPYLNRLLPDAALLTQSFGLHHPSQPNYLELFSGSAQGVCNDRCPTAITAPNLAASLIAAHNPQDPIPPFVGYAEHFAPACSTTPTPGWYAQKHCPWRDFTGLPANVSADFSAFPANFDKLPHVAFVIPSLIDDMHNLSNIMHNTRQEVRNGDTWLEDNLDAYVHYALTHNSILIITWDEDNSHYGNTCNPPNNATRPNNRIPTIIIGQSVKPGRYDTPYDHRNVLRTITDMEGLAPIGGATGSPITGIWK